MQPTDVQIGWTSPRKLSKGADFLQTAVERHAYGAEGHREPERGFDVGEPASGAGFEWPRDLRNGASMPHIMRQERGDGREGVRGSHLVHSKLETQVQDLHKMLQSEAETMHGLTDEVRELRAEKRAEKDTSLRQQLTYKVMKDKLVHSRLKAKVAEAKAKEVETDEVRKLLAAQTSQMQSMQEKLTALAAAKKSSAKHHRARMSSKAAEQDLSSYFTKLDRQEAREEISEAKAKLSKLTGLLGAADSLSSSAATSSKIKAKGKASHGALASMARRGSLLEATASLAPGGSRALGEKKAHKQQLAIVDADSDSGMSLHHLVDELKSATTNEAPYLPI